MKDIVEFIERRRRAFKNSCLSLEPLMDWINWSAKNGTLYYTKTDNSMFDSIGIAWRVPSGDYKNKDLKDFVNSYGPIKENYDVFVLDFFADNKDARRQLIFNMLSNNPLPNKVWAQRSGKTVEITTKLVHKFFKI